MIFFLFFYHRVFESGSTADVAVTVAIAVAVADEISPSDFRVSFFECRTKIKKKRVVIVFYLRMNN